MRIPNSLRVGIVAGEASGDLIASHLIKSLKLVIPELEIEGIAGPRMIEEGCKALYPMEALSVMGIMEVMGKLSTILHIRRQITNHFLLHPPDVFIGIDAPDFNLPIEAKLKSQKNIITVHYNSPTVWAWREYRLKKIAKAVDLMLTQFPFEAAYYESRHIPVRYVGHSLADQIPLLNDKNEYRSLFDLNQDDKVIALLPGSRESEICYLGKLFIDTAIACLAEDPTLKFIVPMVNEQRQKQFQELVFQAQKTLPLQIVIGQSHAAMAASDIVLMACGTATLEALLLKRPMVVAYKASPISYWIGKRLIKIDRFSLPNLLAANHLVPEFIQHDATVENLKNALFEQLNNPDVQNKILEEFTHIHYGLRRNASEQAVNAILSLVTAKAHGDKIEI